MPHRERMLLALAGAFVLASAAALTLAPFAQAATWDIALPPGALNFWAFPVVWAACAATASAVARRQLPEHDPYLLPLAFWLCGWGLALIWRLAPGFGLRQTGWLAAATLALLGVIALPGDLRWLRRYRYTWLTLGLGLTALTLVIGVNPEGFGARLWLGGLGVFLQPAEVLKLLVVVFLAAYLADRREQLFDAAPAPHYLVTLLLMWGFSMALLVAQRDLGAGTLLFAVFLVMVYLASGQAMYVGLGLVLLAAGGVAAYGLFDVVRVRVEAWWDPWADPGGRSFQIVQSLIALAAGGLFGRGPGLGAPGLIPVAHSDFIFAALGEEWGLAGMAAVLAALAAFTARGLHIALRVRGAFSQLLAAGLTAVVGLQSAIIIGGVIKAIPLTGLTLPFMSYGGTSLVVNFIALGLLLRLSAARTAARPRRG